MYYVLSGVVYLLCIVTSFMSHKNWKSALYLLDVV